MTKIKQKRIFAPLIITGYALFGLLLASTLISTTIPFGNVLFQPESLKLNVAVLMISMTLGAILPVLAGYIVGSSYAKSKTKPQRQFNGILYGLLAFFLAALSGYFLTISFELIPEHNTRVALSNLLPAIIALAIITILAHSHTKSPRAKHVALEFKPFSLALLASLVAIPTLVFIDGAAANNLGLQSLIPISIVAVFWLISYGSLKKTQFGAFKRMAWAAVSVSVLFVAIYTLSDALSSASVYLTPRSTMESQMIYGIAAAVLALIGWLVYWRAQVKALGSKSSS